LGYDVVVSVTKRQTNKIMSNKTKEGVICTKTNNKRGRISTKILCFQSSEEEFPEKFDSKGY